MVVALRQAGARLPLAHVVIFDTSLDGVSQFIVVSVDIVNDG